MKSRLTNNILSIKRHQRHLKLAFIVADKDVSDVISDIINWCSFTAHGAGSLIYTLDSLENKLAQSLFKEHDPDILVRVGNISESVMKELEREYLPFFVWDWGKIKSPEGNPTNLVDMMHYIRFPIQECGVSSMRQDDEMFLLSAVLFGFLLPKQKEFLKKYMKFLDITISKDNPTEILKLQPFRGIINFSRGLFWAGGEQYDSLWCYDILERRPKAYHDCIVVDDFKNWENFSLFWNLRAHFGRRMLFLPSFIFEDASEALRDFLWNKLTENHNLTILSSSLNVSEIIRLLDSIPNSRLEKKDSTYDLQLESGKKSKSAKIRVGANYWSEIFGKIKITFGKMDSVPTYFSDVGATVEAPEQTVFDPSMRNAPYAIDFEIPFFKPPKSGNLRYSLGYGSNTRISTIGLTSILRTPGFLSFEDKKFVPIRALHKPMRLIRAIVSDQGFDARASSNGKMATRFLSLLRNLYELHILSGEDVVGFLKQCNPLIRNEKGKTVKKPDEDAALNWGTIQQFLNVSDAPYLSQEFAKKIVSWMVSHGLLKLGATAKCKNCFNKQWIPTDQLKQKTQCNACFSELPKPMGTFHHLEWKYLPNVLLGKAIDQGFLTALLTIHYLTYENRQSQEKMTFSYPGIDILKEGDHVAELDLFVVSEGEIITGECKIGRDVTEKEIEKVISMSEDIGADVALFCTLANFSEECLDLINVRADQTKLKVAVLQSDQLLNQTLHRKLEKQISQRNGLEKSYRQIFVEDVIRNL